jgi:hypothetical protein
LGTENAILSGNSNQIKIILPDVPGKTNRAGDQFLEGCNKRDGDSPESKSRVASAAERKDNYVDGNQNDDADDEHHFPRKHRSISLRFLLTIRVHMNALISNL